MRGIFLILIFSCAIVCPAWSATFKVPAAEPIATVTLPEKWKSTELGENVKSVSPDGAIQILVISPERAKVAEAMGEAMRYLRGTGGITVTAESMKKDKGKLSEMDVQHVTWQAKDKNGEIKIRFSVISIAEKKPLLVAYWGSPAAEKKHRADIDKILRSIKRA
jgi:hypothetical protein